MKTLRQGMSAYLRLMCPLRLQKCGVHMSSIYRPVLTSPPNVDSGDGKNKKVPGKKDVLLSKSQKLFIENGIIKQSSCPGAYHFLPLGLRSLEKLVKLVDRYMQGLQNCQKMQMPTLTSAALWNTTGRLDECGVELMKLQDRHSKSFLLSPTHEEAICDLIKNPTLTHRQLPQRLYQITEKFRDEKRPRFGLLRGRQFLMKDLYTFDVDVKSARKTYDEINEIYGKLLDSLDLKWIKAYGATGSIGGSESHEFHLISEIGEDSIIHCGFCNESFNVELLEREEIKEVGVSVGGSSSVTVIEDHSKCYNCGSASSLSSMTSIEVAHSFLLGTKYTEPMEVYYKNENNENVLLEMGCYGLGVSRLLAASVEVKSSENSIRWPARIAPYLVSILPPKQGSKEEERGNKLALKVYDSLRKIIPGDVIYDDRTKETIGKRMIDMKKLGIPYVIVCGKAINDPSGALIEFHDVNEDSMTLQDSENIIKMFYDIRNKLNSF